MDYLYLCLLLCLVGGSYAIQKCSQKNVCNWPIASKTENMKDCRCPETYLNINDECCLSQWWIIGISLGTALILILIILTMLFLLLAISKKKKAMNQLLNLNEERLHRTMRENTKTAEGGATEKVTFSTKSTHPHNVEENDYISQPLNNPVFMRNEAFQPDEDFQRQSRIVMNRRRSNLLGYQPTALVSEEVASMAKDQQTQSSPPLNPPPTSPPYNFYIHQPFISPPIPSFTNPSTYYTNPNLDEFTIKRPTMSP